MTGHDLFDTALRLWQVVVVPVAGWGAWVLTDIRNQLRTLNGRMLTMEQWRADHDKQDDHRHESVTRDVERIQERVFDLRGLP